MSSVSFRMLLASSNQVIFSASEKLSGFLASTKFDLGDLTRNLRWLLCWLIQWIHWGHCIPLMLKVTARGHGVTMSCWDTSSPITWTWGWRLFLKHVGSEGQCEELKQFRLAPGGERKKVKDSEVTQSCPTLCDPMDCSPPGSSIHGIFQARVLEWGAIAFFRRSSQPRDWTRVSCTVDRCFTIWATREVTQK